MKIAILTDSSYGGNIKDYKDLYQVPLVINEENGNEIYDDGMLSQDEFYKLLDNQILKTSLTPPGIMLKIWDELLKNYDQIIFAGISKGLSGQYNTFRLMSETDEKYKERVFIVDTNGVSIVLEHEIELIAGWISKNKTGSEILELINNYHAEFKCFILPKSLETLKRGGRISPTAAALAKVLKIVPILNYNGAIDKEGTARTFKKAITESLNKIKKYCRKIECVDLAYSRCDKELIDLVKTIIKKEGLHINIERFLPNVISAHTGPNTVAIVGWKKTGG